MAHTAKIMLALLVMCLALSACSDISDPGGSSPSDEVIRPTHRLSPSGEAVPPSGSAPTWPSEVERVDIGQDGSEKSMKLRAKVRDFVAHIRPDLRVEQDAAVPSPDGSNATLTIGVLVSDSQNHYGVLIAIFTDPPITRSDGACLPSLRDRCSTHDLRAGKAMAVDNSSLGQGQRLVTAELIRSDGSVPVTVRSIDRPYRSTGKFWDGGNPLPSVPLTVEQAVKLLDVLTSE